MGKVRKEGPWTRREVKEWMETLLFDCRLYALAMRGKEYGSSVCSLYVANTSPMKGRIENTAAAGPVRLSWCGYKFIEAKSRWFEVKSKDRLGGIHDCKCNYMFGSGFPTCIPTLWPRPNSSDYKLFFSRGWTNWTNSIINSNINFSAFHALIRANSEHLTFIHLFLLFRTNFFQ